MTLTSSITPYNSDWPSLYAQAAARLVPIFGAALAEIHHVGSTAVPGLSAKPEIDVVAVVHDMGAADAVMEPLQRLGYRRGGDLSSGHAFFKRDVDGVRTHKIHVCVVGHPKVQEMLQFRDHLRRNEAACIQYAALKLRLERENTRGIGEYLEGKAPFIRALVAGLQGDA